LTLVSDNVITFGEDNGIVTDFILNCGQRIEFSVIGIAAALSGLSSQYKHLNIEPIP
jgi:hypothetical protein